MSHTELLPNLDVVTTRTIDFTNAYRGRGLNRSPEVECQEMARRVAARLMTVQSGFAAPELHWQRWY